MHWLSRLSLTSTRPLYHVLWTPTCSLPPRTPLTANTLKRWCFTLTATNPYSPRPGLPPLQLAAENAASRQRIKTELHQALAAKAAARTAQLEEEKRYNQEYMAKMGEQGSLTF